jgi:hypothetical protein
MAVLSNIRADFLTFTLKTVEHSRFLPDGSRLAVVLDLFSRRVMGSMAACQDEPW